jgi:hypothetical protein
VTISAGSSGTWCGDDGCRRMKMSVTVTAAITASAPYMQHLFCAGQTRYSPQAKSVISHRCFP